MIVLRLLGLLVLMVPALACTTVSAPTDSAAPPPGSPGPTSISGTWNVTLTVTGGNQLPAGSQLQGTMTLDAAPDSNTLAGTLTLGTGLTGTIQGSQAGHGFVMTTGETAPCHSGSFDTPDGHANGAFTQITGTFDGRDCNGKLVASLVAVRRN